MKTNIARILCIVMIWLTATMALTACKSNDATPTNVNSDVSSDIGVTNEPVIIEVGEDDPYVISKNKQGKDIVILVPGKDGTVTMEVASNTTLEEFLAVVTAKEGFAIRILNTDGKEITDVKAKIANDMTFAVYQDGSDTAKVQYPITVVSEKEIQQTIVKAQEQQQAASKNNTANSNSNGNSTVANDKDTQSSHSSAVTSAPKQSDLILSSVWSSLYSSKDSVGQVWRTTFNQIEKNQGISTEVTNLNGTTAADLIVKEVMAGKASADVYEVSAFMCRSIARKKALTNIFDSKTLKRSLFDNAGTESVTFNGTAYGVAIDANATKPMGVIYNKDLIRKYASDYDLAKLFNEKKWTFDTFQTVARACTRDLNGDGKSDVYGFTSNTNIIGMALTSNAGGTALMKNGKVEATMCNDAGITALEWMKDMFKNDKSWKYCANIKDSITFFANGQAAMFASWMAYYNEIAPKADFSFGFVLMPIGPDQKDYITGQYDSKFFVVPKTKASRLDVIGNWLNGAAGASNRLINLEIQKMARNGMDSTSQNIYKWAVTNATPEYSSGVFSTSVSASVDNSVTSSSQSPSKVMLAIRSQAQKELDDFFANLY